MSRDRKGRFQTGNIGGPGRPRGSRNLLSEEFVAAVYADFTKHGEAVLSEVRSNSPGTYLRVVASLIPRDVSVQVASSELERLSDLELVDLLHREAASLLQERSKGSED